MPIEEIGETWVKTDCLNFYVSLLKHIEKQILIRGIEIIFSVAF